MESKNLSDTRKERAMSLGMQSLETAKARKWILSSEPGPRKNQPCQHLGFSKTHFLLLTSRTLKE